MAVDYLKQKVDFYRNYESKNYETFFNDEVNPAYNIITSSSSGAELQRKVRNVRENLAGLNLEWKDSVNSQFQSYIASCEEYLKTIEGSIEEQFIGLAEKAYKELYTLLGNLKEQNIAYQKKFNEKPSSDDFEVSAEYENGILIKEGYFRQDDYDRAINDWKISLGELAGNCITTIASIEEQKTILNSVNMEVPKFENSDSSIDSSVPQFDGSLFNNSLGLTGTVEEYIADNGLKYLKITKWGQEFYVLADIKGGTKQTNNECLSYSNAYARDIMNKTDSNASRTNKTYTSMDKQAIMKIAATELLAGHPVTLEVQGTEVGKKGKVTINTIVDGQLTQETVYKCNRHFVTAYGIKAGANLDNLQESDFIYLDPAGGEVKQLATNNGGSQRRDLLHAQAATYQDWGSTEYYRVTIYDDSINYNQVMENVEYKGAGTQNNVQATVRI